MQRLGRKFVTTAAIVAAVALGGAGVALADNIYNNLDGTIDAAAEVMPLNAGGSTGTTTLFVDPTNGDSKNGCNLTGTTTLGVSVSSSNPAVATVSPGSVTFTSCGDSKALTVTPVAVGTATISVAQTGNTTGGTFDFAPATFTVNVTTPAPANTAPTVTVTGVTGGAGYDKGAVPAATCQVADAEDGNRSFPATLSAVTGSYAADGIGSQTASCSYTDTGGLLVAASLTYSIVDPTAPVITSALSPATPDGDHDWYRSDVGLTWTVAEPESPSSLVKTGCADQTIATDQGTTTYSCAATSAGGQAAPVAVTVKRDATPPTGVAFTGGPAAGQSYFAYYLPAAPTCTATDALSGLAGCDVTGYSDAVGPHTLTAPAKDGGNVATSTSSYTVRPDLGFGGFFAPVDNGGVYNTVPLKFTVSDEGVNQTATSVVEAFTQQKVSCTPGTAEDAVQITSTGGTTLRYDATAGQFVQNWKIPTGAGTCCRATVTTIDHVAHSALFKVK